jgi:hypothetical protein
MFLTTQPAIASKLLAAGHWPLRAASIEGFTGRLLASVDRFPAGADMTLLLSPCHVGLPDALSGVRARPAAAGGGGRSCFACLRACLRGGGARAQL